MFFVAACFVKAAVIKKYKHDKLCSGDKPARMFHIELSTLLPVIVFYK